MKDHNQNKRDMIEFHKLKIAATTALKNWAVNITKEAIELIPKSIDEKFD